MKGVYRAFLPIVVCVAVLLGLVPGIVLRNSGPVDWLFPNASAEFEQDCGRFVQFFDESQIEEYIKVDGAMPPTADYRMGGPTWNFNGPTTGASPGGVLAGGPGSTQGSDSYSRTNVQVEGVDELDIVKTDGRYIYTVSGTRVVALDAYPPAQARVLSTMELEGEPYGLFLDGDRLVVIMPHLEPQQDSWYGGYYSYNSMTSVSVYDVSDPSSPRLVRTLSVDGSFTGARLTRGYAYVMLSNYLYEEEDELKLPVVTEGRSRIEMAPSQMGHFREEPNGNTMTIVLAIKTDSEGGYGIAGFLTGWVGTLYVSKENIYLASTFYETVITFFDEQESAERSAIHKIAFDNLRISYVCSGEVPGRLLNQFSMDEYEGYLRVATTTGYVGRFESGSGNHVFVLDSRMALAGSLTGLAPGEQIHSARFLGDRAYLVTFKKIDPFFVIDLSLPFAPRVLGYLKIPGYSDYLHPFGPNHVIGLGKDTVEGEGGDFAWYQGLKLSLFDVTDVAHPNEVSKVVIGDRGTDSEALSDHKAFLFSAERGLLVVPVNLAEIPDSKNQNGRPSWTYGEFIWQGVYVYSVSTDAGFVFRGRITHDATPGYYYCGGPLVIRRSLYIEDVLYSISEEMVKLNSLSDLAELRALNL